VNEVILHAGFPGAPFGGVGGSGHGYYHGKYGFDSFTHLRTVMVSPGWLQRSLEFRFPPFGNREVPKSLVIKANFKRGETIEDQRRGDSFLTMNRISVATAFSFFGILYCYYR
jgi:aldehyde dehydrogenase (NAD+)